MHKIILNSFLSILFCIMIISFIRVISSRTQEDINVNKLKSVLMQEQIQNSNLKKEYSFYTSSEYVEQVSRDQLGLVKKGETVIVLPSSPQTSNGVTAGSVNIQPSPLLEWISLFKN